ncbi:glycosyltransferase [Neoconidiobolus thromboides FSU 785]|nr:glycosyltransferase [Neoconidiobolus thromboides FSU 785]
MLTLFINILLISITTLCMILLYIGHKTKPLPTTEEELTYFTDSKEEILLYSITSKSLVNLTVVIPAYNESLRLPKMLEETLAYLKERQSRDFEFEFEILIVCDGSTDGTSELALKWKKDNNLKEHQLMIVRNLINRGKGGSVRRGMLHAKGDLILFADADGATEFRDIDKLEMEMNKIIKDGLGMVVGSRHHLKNSEAVVNRSFLRNLLMNGFHLYLYILGIKQIQDTQCGFKLFSRKAAFLIFNNLHVEGWIFDIECLILANYFNIPLKEVMVNWQEIDGSKVNIIKDAIKMALDLLMIRLCYFYRVWSITTTV